ncbi:hypothetical protein NKH77_41380 [Streptomyces sp. M19]
MLLVDELDKGDVDLPNDLLTVFEEGEFEIPELARLSDEQPGCGSPRRPRAARASWSSGPGAVRGVPGRGDHQQRRARLPARVPAPLRTAGPARPGRGAAARHRQRAPGRGRPAGRRRPAPLLPAPPRSGELATDQLLNAVFLRAGGVDLDADGLLDAVLHRLGGSV